MSIIFPYDTPSIFEKYMRTANTTTANTTPSSYSSAQSDAQKNTADSLEEELRFSKENEIIAVIRRIAIELMLSTHPKDRTSLYAEMQEMFDLLNTVRTMNVIGLPDVQVPEKTRRQLEQEILQLRKLLENERYEREIKNLPPWDKRNINPYIPPHQLWYGSEDNKYQHGYDAYGTFTAF